LVFYGGLFYFGKPGLGLLCYQRRSVENKYEAYPSGRAKFSRTSVYSTVDKVKST
jgi:hypothetical protein